MSERQIFELALDRPDPVERAAYLDQAYGGDAELRRRVDELLHAHSEPSTFLGLPAPLDPTAGLVNAGLTEPPDDQPAASSRIVGPARYASAFQHIHEPIGSIESPKL
jgi:hypothetical protein